MQKDIYKPLTINEILDLNDEEFIDNVYKRNNFTFRGRNRRFKYRTTNELIDKLSNYLDVRKDLNILSISGSGIQLFETLSESSKIPNIILAFDYSPKQVAYNYLLKVAIKTLSFEDFKAYFGLSEPKIDRILIRKKLINMIPRQFRTFLPVKHEFNKRDLLLNSVNNATFLKTKSKFGIIKENIERIKFFEYEIHHKNLRFSKIFEKGSFDRVYLSNVPDWLCWHNKDIINCKPLLGIYRDIKNIIKDEGFIVLSNLLSRASHVPAFLSKVNIIHQQKNQIYKYSWLNCKIACH